MPVGRNRRSSAILPSPEQALLLAAIFGPDAGAAGAIRAWESRTNLDTLDSASTRLLPLAYHRLTRLGIASPNIARYKGWFRQTIYRNHLLLGQARVVLQRFDNAAIPALVLKGAALAHAYYPHFGLRPMNDFDVLVPSTAAAGAIDATMADGVWLPDLRLVHAQVEVRHATAFRTGAGLEIDLHWHLLHEACFGDADLPFWSSAVPLSLPGLATRMLCPSDMLFHICAHGSKWCEASPYWVADALCVYRRDPASIDWSRIADLAIRRELTPALLPTLTHLRETWQVAVPPEILREICRAPVRPIALRYHDHMAGPPRPVQILLGPWIRYARITSHLSFWRRLVGFPRHLRLLWDKDSFWELPATAIQKIREQILGRTAGRSET